MEQIMLMTRATVSRKPHHNTYVQLVRSLAVSVVALTADFGLLIVFKEILQLNYLAAATFSFTFGVLVNYVLSTYWVFPQRKLASRQTELLLFVVICTLGLIFNLLIIAVMVEHAGFDYRLAKLVSTIAVFFWNFVARKKLLY